MVEFPEFVRFDADLDAYTKAGAWSDVYSRTPTGQDRVTGQDTFSNSHQGAHAVGRDLTSTIRVYELINQVYDQAGLPNFAGADDTSNGALLPTSAKGGINGRVAVHRGQQTADFDAIMHDKDNPAGSAKFLDVLGQNMVNDLRDAMSLEQRVEIARSYQIEVQNYQNYATLRFLHQDVLDKMFGPGVVKSIPLNGADGTIKVSGTDTIANREAARKKQSDNLNMDNDADVRKNPAFIAISDIRGNDPNMGDIRVIANFKQVVKDGDLRLHPIVTKLVDAETLEKMGASKIVPSAAPTNA